MFVLGERKKIPSNKIKMFEVKKRSTHKNEEIGSQGGKELNYPFVFNHNYMKNSTESVSNLIYCVFCFDKFHSKMLAFY